MMSCFHLSFYLCNLFSVIFCKTASLPYFYLNIIKLSILLTINMFLLSVNMFTLSTPIVVSSFHYAKNCNKLSGDVTKYVDKIPKLLKLFRILCDTTQISISPAWQRRPIWNPNWGRLAPNVTNLGLFQISFSTFWLNLGANLTQFEAKPNIPV